MPNGDLNGDSVVNAGDVVLAQRIAMGSVTAIPDQLSRGDVAPISAPDGAINAGDVVVIQRLVMGLIKTYTITASADANGTISPSGIVSVISGATATFTVTPNTGYHVSDVLVDGVSHGAITSYTFTKVTANHTIAANFAIDTYTITASADANGTIVPSGVVSVNSGATTTFIMTPYTGYHVSDVLVDSVSQGAITSYTFTNVTASHTIAANFAIDTYTITASAGANGTISQSGVVSVNSGATAMFIMTPNTGYHVLDVLVDGASVGAVSSYTITNVTAGHAITVSFAINTCTITATADSNGTISPSGIVSVNFGATTTFIMTPTTGSNILDVIVDGASVGAMSTYTFANITANHTISASFTVSSGSDDTNIYCMGTGTVLVGPSTFTNNINVPSSNNNVWIASPLNYSIITGTKTIIKGAMDTTIPVNTVSVLVANSAGSTSYLVQVNDKYFAAQVNLSAGNNAITLTATDQNSGQHQASVIVTGAALPDNVTLLASPNVGIPTLKASGKTLLDVSLMTSASLTTTVANYAWDFNGSGVNSLTCYSHNNVMASYEQVGLYLATVIVTDSAGNKYKDMAIVNVVDATQMDNIFKPIWNGMKNALKGGNATGALNYITPSSRQKYGETFTALQADIVQIATSMQDIAVVFVRDTVAKYRIKRDQNINGQYGAISYYIYFRKDSNGQWLIDEF